NITVFSALTPVYAIATGFFILGEVPQPMPLLGMVIICGSIYALFLKRDHSMSLAMNALQPFRNIIASKPIFCAFLSTIPTAFAAAFQKQLLGSMPPLMFTFWLLLIIGSLAMIACMVTTPKRDIIRQAKSLPIGFLIASVVLLPLMHWLFCLVIIEHQTALSLVLQRTSIVFQVILAYIFLKERTDSKKRAAAILFIMFGFGLIIYSNGHH
ncbi:MAG: EamA family transporter, partial [Bacteroidota bacterium]